MEKNKIIEYYQHLLISFNTYLKKTAELQEMEDIHQMRVSIKKIRAVLNVLEISGNHEYHKQEHLILFHNLFQTAGKIREAQLNLSLIGKCKGAYLLSYTEYLLQTKKIASEELREEIKLFDNSKLNALNKDLLIKCKEIPDQTLIQEALMFISDKFQKIIKLKARTQNDILLHKIRKHLKQTSEILTLLSEMNCKKEVTHLKSVIKSLASATGKWHDTKVLIDSINYFVQQNPKEQNKLYLVNLIKRLEAKNEAVRKKIYDQLKTNITKQQIKQLDSILTIHSTISI